MMMPGGQPLDLGERLIQGGYAESLRLIAREGAPALHDGALGDALTARVNRGDDAAGWLTLDDLRDYKFAERTPIIGNYRGYQIVGPPPPASMSRRCST